MTAAEQEKAAKKFSEDWQGKVADPALFLLFRYE